MTKRLVYLHLLAVLLYLCAVGIRIAGLGLADPQPDERLWVERSQTLMHRLVTDPVHATSHLGHPGVPPAFLMGIGQEFGKDSFSPLNASRLTTALVSALAVPVIFLFAAHFLGFWTGLVGAGLLLLDPRHIGYSRLAHLDAQLTTFVVLTVCCYVFAVRRNSLKLTCLAGVFWGLAIATKPTAVTLLGAFLVYQFCRSLLKKDFSTLLRWRDLGAVLIGQITFVLIYTRMWERPSQYLRRLGIKSKLARELFQDGRYLQKHPLELAAILFAFILAGSVCYWLYKRKGSRWFFHGTILAGIAVFFFSTLPVFPAVYENVVRFWTWVLGLSGENHSLFGTGRVVDPPGYALLFWTQTSPLMQLGLVATLLWFLFGLLKRRFEERDALIVFLVAIFVIWVAPLYISSKQAWRYVAPSVPFLCIVSGYGICRVAKIIPVRRWIVAMSVLAITLHSVDLFRWAPNYLLYFNPISGGLPAAIERKQGIAFAGQSEVMDFLLSRAAKQDGTIVVAVAGDRKTLEMVYKDQLKSCQLDKAGLITFGYFPPILADYVVTFASHGEMLAGTPLEQVLTTKPVYQSILNGGVVVEAFEVPYEELPNQYRYRHGITHNATGSKTEVDGVLKIEADPATDNEGYLLFDSGLRLKPGRYRFSFNLSSGLARDVAVVARVSMGESTERVLTTRDLGLIDLDFEVSEEKKFPITVYWPGEVAASVSNLIIKRPDRDRARDR